MPMIPISDRIELLTPIPECPERPLLVYLPGMDGTGHLLRSQIPSLQPHFDIRCLSIPPNDRSSWQDLAGSVIDLIRQEIQRGAKRPVYLCGESFGGCLALQMLLDAPGCADRAVLFNPASSFQQISWLQWGATLSGWVPEVLQPLAAMGVLPLLAVLPRIAPGDRPALLHAMQSVSAKTSSWRLAQLQAFEVSSDQLRRIYTPLLVVAGGGDRLLPSVAEAKRIVTRSPQARMVVLPHSGHACLLEREVNVYQILRENDFLPSLGDRVLMAERSFHG